LITLTIAEIVPSAHPVGDDGRRLVHHLGNPLDLAHDIADHATAVGRQLAGTAGHPIGILGVGRQLFDPRAHLFDRRRHGRRGGALLLAAAVDPAPTRQASWSPRAPRWHRGGRSRSGRESTHHLVQAVADELQFVAGTEVDTHAEIAGGDRARVSARRSMLPMVA
jgi:hypothetical protein